jgi:DNA helicase-2/ATP-dependent DNA helicase PcrA
MPGTGDALLFELLHAGWFGVPPVEIARLCVELAGRQYSERKTSLRKLLQEKINMPPLDLFTPALHEGLGKASEMTEQWIREPDPIRWVAAVENWLLQNPLPPVPLIAEGQRPEIEKPEPGFINPLVKRFTMNVTALNNYLHCPLEFYYRNILRVPSPGSEAAEFGSAVHYALEALFGKMLNSPGTGRQRSFASVETLIADFERYMQLNRNSFTVLQFEKRLAYGQEVLNKYYATYIYSFPTIVSIERMFNIVYNGIPLKGKPDKLEFDGKAVNIVDYKTGNHEKAKARLQPPHEKEPNGGDYWRQAVFYKILVDNYSQKGWKAASVEFDFIEPGADGQYYREKLFITPADVTTVTQQITEAWQQIQNQAFYTGCGKANCQWCGFVKTYGLDKR